MQEIILACGTLTKISDIDYDYLKQFPWHLAGSRGDGYATTVVTLKDGQLVSIMMHHIILERMELIIPYGYEADHKDIDTFNNQRDNLRVVTKSINRHNTRTQHNNTSGERGVHYDRRTQKWVARISINGQRICLGYFNSFEEAIQARKKAEKGVEVWQPRPSANFLCSVIRARMTIAQVLQDGLCRRS